MVFILQSFSCARHYQKGITIKSVMRFEDCLNWYPYCYSQGDLTFEFRVAYYREWRMFVSYNDTSLGMTDVVAYVLENSIPSKCRSLSSAQYQDLKQNIIDGMWALATSGGFHLRWVPDFRVEFVQNMKDVLEQAPRPTTTDDVKKASFFEKPLMLAGHQINGFVFEDCRSYDAEKGITITRIGRFEEIGFDDPKSYIYSQRDLKFEFRALQYREWRVKFDGDGEKRIRPHTATYIIENSIKRGMLKAKCRSLTVDAYQELKLNIKEGMWVVESLNGQALQDVPGFRVEFVDLVSDIPNR